MIFKIISPLLIVILVLVSISAIDRVSAQEKQTPDLTQGIERDWTSYVQRRLIEQIIRDGRHLKILESPIGMEPSYVYVSINYPYRILCNDEAQMGLSVVFGTGQESDIFVTLTGIFSPKYRNEPELDVSPNSIAAKNLDMKLCKLAADWMEKQIANQP